MSFFSDAASQLDRLSALCGEEILADSIPAAVARLEPDDAIAVIEAASALVRSVEVLRIAAAGVVAAASRREHGQNGVSQGRGHRTTISLVQELMGSTKTDASRHVRLGESLLAGGASDSSPSAPVDVPPAPRWHAPLDRALLTGGLSAAQHDAISRGLGEPPEGGGADDATVAAWSAAAEQLAVEAHARTVEELARAARTIRDVLDPAGAERRFDERFAGRSFRMWVDQDGLSRASISFDDEAALWVRTIIDAALRPRRGGPRFVDPSESARADELASDPRSNDQLAYDLIVDTLRAGSLADAASVFGTRQAAVRLVITADAVRALHEGRSAIGHAEDDQSTLPAWVVAQHVCTSGTVTCTFGRDGEPLSLGREKRLFTPQQRIALALRDGGCRWNGCDRPASYCEAHHIDSFAGGGRTDVDRGILLCRFHHMQLHHGGWRITREERGDFVLHPPDGASPIILATRLARTYAWAGIDPPPRRFRPVA